MNTTIIEFENKIPDTSSLNTATVLDTKISDHAKYITTQEFNKLTAENFAATLKQVDLVSKTDFYNKLISFNRKITSNKTKYLEVQKKLNCLKTKDFFLWENFFYIIWWISKHIHLSTNTWYVRIKKGKGTDYVISLKSKAVYNSKLKPLYTAFLHSIKFSGWLTYRKVRGVCFG